MSQQAEVEDERDDLELDTGDDTLEGGTGADTQEGASGTDTLEGGDADDEVVISFDGEAAPASKGDDSGLVKQLRAEIRKLQQGQKSTPQPQKIEVGPKPTLESCDYDEAKFETELDAWKDRQAEADEADREAGKAGEAQRAAFAEEVATFGRQKAALGLKDFDTAEETVIAALSTAQVAALLLAADDKAKVIYALGKHPAKLTELAAIGDPIKFAATVVRIEGKLSVTTKRRTAPDPDVPERGSGRLSDTKDKKLEQLEKEAERTGDRTAVVQYKRQLKAQSRA